MMSKRIPMTQEGRRRAEIQSMRREKAGKAFVLGTMAVTVALIVLQVRGF
jgi:hypothetical protein